MDATRSELPSACFVRSIDRKIYLKLSLSLSHTLLKPALIGQPPPSSERVFRSEIRYKYQKHPFYCV